MKTSVGFPVEYKLLGAFFILAYVLSWSIAVPLALARQGIIPPLLPTWSHYLIAFGPLLSALIVTALGQGSDGLRELARRFFKWQVCPRWWVIAFSPLILGLLVLAVLNLFTGSHICVSDLGQVNFLPPLGVAAWFLWFFTFGLGEETGWRGFALPLLQKERSAYAATLILASFWALWHLPVFFYLFDPAMALGWVIGLFAGAVVLTWLFNSSQGSIPMVAIFHASLNFVTASTADTGALPAVVSVIFIGVAILVIRFAGPKYLLTP